MNSRIKRIFPILIALLLLLPVSSIAKPTPPGNLMKIFTHFLAGEDLVEEDNWVQTDKWLQDLNTEYQGIRPVISKDLPAASLEKFEKAMAALRDNNAAQKRERNHSLFIAMHQSFLELLDKYDYKLPPLMYLVQNDLKEAETGLKDGEFDEVQDELRDVEIFYGQLVPAIRARGISSEMIESFKAQLVRCKGAATADDKKLTTTELAKLQHLFSTQYRLLNI